MEVERVRRHFLCLFSLNKPRWRQISFSRDCQMGDYVKTCFYFLKRLSSSQVHKNESSFALWYYNKRKNKEKIMGRPRRKWIDIIKMMNLLIYIRMNMLFASLLPPELFKFVNIRHVTSFLKMSGEGEGRSTQEFLKSKIKKKEKKNISQYSRISKSVGCGWIV